MPGMIVEQLSKQDQEQYMLSKKTEEIYKRSVEYAAKVNREEGRVEGKAEGLAEGVLTVAKTMKQNGVSDADIMKFTGLSKEQTERL